MAGRRDANRGLRRLDVHHEREAGNPHQSSECTTPLRPAGERNRAVGSRAAASAAFTVTWLRDEAAATKIVV